MKKKTKAENSEATTRKTLIDIMNIACEFVKTQAINALLKLFFKA